MSRLLGRSKMFVYSDEQFSLLVGKDGAWKENSLLDIGNTIIHTCGQKFVGHKSFIVIKFNLLICFCHAKLWPAPMAQRFEA